MSQTARTAVPARYSIPLWGLRAAVLAQTAVLVWEFVTAGRLVEQDFTALSLHAGGAIVLHVVAGLQFVAALLLWRPGRGSPLPAVVSALAFGLGFVQAYLGSHLMLELHVPVAMLLVVLVAWVLVWTWTRSAGRVSA
ncbi:hypothetical protein [Nocardiopsis ansamitocini]|uniref:Uncharacterized protein n=1 Tax=Nocardiopsis ansamitocini TaxID=1670832 RepID=A0A9W6P8D9_9ACTN|nr:hypothetical protein [Nocardiopsis ansamitocini]GLU49450.1 hypothetical protein Nans01_38010 [Nocardiopsis ansamitocini]